LKYYKQLAKNGVESREKGHSSSASSISERSRPLFYHRSDHLDNIVFLLLETENSGATERFKSREKKDHEYLRSIGIDPYSNPGLYEEEVENHNGPSSSHVSTSSKFGSNRNQLKSTVIVDESGEYSEFSDDSAVILRRKLYSNGPSSRKQVCEFCAESDHDFPNCPHRESGSEEDSDDSDFVEEDD